MDVITSKVLSFYKELPFNVKSSPDKGAETIRMVNHISKEYPFLTNLIKEQRIQKVLDVGCGGGWFSNTLAYHYDQTVVGIDLNPLVIEYANKVNAELGLKNQFKNVDLFEYQGEGEQFDLIISHGCLHHTKDCMGAVRHLLQDLLKPGGYALIGLYHLHGRKPFLDHFKDLAESGFTEEQLFEEYKRLHRMMDDETYQRSWFRDQVLHPHETQHTVEEMIPLIEECNCTLVKTSVNDFREITDMNLLFQMEQHMSNVAEDMLNMGSYYPGFFEVLLLKSTTN